jgi:hypothetical protein
MQVGDLVRSTWRIDAVTGLGMTGIIVDMMIWKEGNMTKTPLILWTRRGLHPDRWEYLEAINESRV